MGKLKFTLTHLWFWAILGITVLMCENVPFLYSSHVDGKTFTYTSLGLLSILLILLYFVYYFFEHKKNKLRFDYVLLPILVILFITMMIGTWSSPASFIATYNDKSAIVEIDLKQRIISTVETFFTFVFIYLLSFTQARYGFKRKGLPAYCYWYIAFSFVAIGYSIATEFNVYQAIFKFENGRYVPTPKSFFGNQNIYALMLMVGVMDLIVIKSVKHHWWVYPIIILFLVECFIVKTATVFFILSIVVTVSLIIDIVTLFKKNPFIGVTVLSVIMITVIGFFLFISLNLGKGNKFVDYIDYQLFTRILTKNFETFSGRKPIWDITIQLLTDSPLFLIFGLGQVIEKNTITQLAHDLLDTGYQSAHNGYLELMLKGGLIGIVIYGLAMIYFIYVCFRLVAKGKVRYGFSFLICLLGLLAHSMTESTYFFGGTVSCVIETWLIFLPPIVYYKQLKHPDFRRATINANAWQNSITVPNMTRMIAFAIFGFLVAIIVPFLIFQNNFSIMFKDILVLAIIELAICLLFLPYLFSLWYKRSTTRGFYYTMIIWLLVFFGVAPGLLVLIYNLTGVKDYSLLSYLKVGLPLSSLALMSFALLVSSLTKGGSFIQWIKETFIGAFKLGLVHLAFMLITFFAAMVYIWNQPSVEMLDVLFVTAISLAVYFALFMFINTKSYRSIKDEINDNRLLYYRRAAIREEMENVR